MTAEQSALVSSQQQLIQELNQKLLQANNQINELKMELQIKSQNLEKSERNN